MSVNSSHTDQFKHLELKAQQIVEGFMSGLHKSPFHGYSAEFAEHKMYHPGSATRFIDWKLFARTEKLYTKKFEEETNMRCHLVLDQSSSMYYPEIKNINANELNKIGFSVLASASIMQLLRRQRDAVGLSIYDDKEILKTQAKSSERHHHFILGKLEEISKQLPQMQMTNTAAHLSLLAQQLPRRSMVIIFSDLIMNADHRDDIFESMRHLKYRNHDVVLMHTFDGATEREFNFGSTPRKFRDLETGREIPIFPGQVHVGYKEKVQTFFEEIKINCAQHKIQYVEADIQKGFNPVFTAFLVARQKFI
jgi:uncharacterized protein (DUF58 family)